MGRKKGRENGTNERTEINIPIAIRDDIQGHIRKIYPLCELISGGLSAEGGSTEPALSLAKTYLHASVGLELFSFYHLAKQVHQLTQYFSDGSKKAAGDTESITYLCRLYAGRWKEMPISIQRSVQRDFESRMHAGSMVLRLVAWFGTGILLTWKVNVHRL
jgi:hypothetical protein